MRKGSIEWKPFQHLITSPAVEGDLEELESQRIEHWILLAVGRHGTIENLPTPKKKHTGCCLRKTRQVRPQRFQSVGWLIENTCQKPFVQNTCENHVTG